MKNLSLGIACLWGLAACNNTSKLAGSSDAALVREDAATLNTGGQQGTGGLQSMGGQLGSGGAVASGGIPMVDSGGALGKGGASASSTGGTGTGGWSGSGGAGGMASGGTTVVTGGTAGATITTATGGQTSAGSGGAGNGAGGAKTGGSGSGGLTGTGGSTVVANPGAPETKPLGYGQAATGGGSTTAVDASTMAAIQAAIDAYSGSGGLTIRYTGKFDFSTISDPCTQWHLTAQIVEIKKKNDITLIGADGSAANFGIHIASSSSNIIVRNMTFGLLPGGDSSDAISVEGMSGGVPTNIWIDHNELFSSMATCEGAGDSSFDGLIDMKKGADKVTVSYNYVHDHHKVSLNGYSDSDTAIRHVTFHHNIFENAGSRTPLQRGGFSHILNNYFNKVETSGINVRMDGHSLIEGNYFENVQNPVTSRDSSAIGDWELRSNNIASPSDFTKFSITWVASSSTPAADATDWTTTATYPEALGYTYTADSFQCIKDNLRSVAGAGKSLATLKCK
jgi:pectate lyase